MMKIPKILERFKPKRSLPGKLRGHNAARAKQTTAPPPASPHWINIGLTALTIVLLSALMSVNLMPDRIELRRGDISHRDVRAARSVIYVNSTKTALAQQAARLATPPVYDRDEGAASNASRITQEFFDRIERERALIAKHAPTRAGLLEQSVSHLETEFNSFSRSQFQFLLTVSPALFQNLRDVTANRIKMAMMIDIHDKYDQSHPSMDLIHAQHDVANTAQDTLSSEDAAIVQGVARLALRPNLLFNLQKTELARDTNSHNVQPVYEQISRGDKIIGANEKVTQEHVDKFTALGLLNPHLALETGIGVCILAAVMVLLVVYFIARALPKLYEDTRRLTLLAVIVLISVFGLKVGGMLFGMSFSSGQVGYLGMMTVVAAGMLVSVLLDMQLAVLVVALLAVQSGLIINHEIRFTVMTLMSSLVGIFSVGSVRRKNNLLTITAALAVANVSLVWLMGMIQRDSLLELFTGSGWAVGSAAFATFLYWFGVLALERPFGILTHTTLLEMSAPDRPLLQQLCMVAPGTYAHSMLVGTLAEAGAQAIGADALLCRVGGYYHDIGKMSRPDFFVENQRNGNVHGRLSPSLSSLIITAHVRDGVQLAQEHRIPKEIQDIIAEHHGTTLIRYFYHQALTDCGGTDEAPPGLEERFRYPGPKPQARESAIVMLADSVEAAARCLDSPTQEALSRLVTSIVRDKMEDGQFDECRMTFHDVKRVTDAFLHVLTAMMHARVDYPKDFPKTASGRPMEVVRSDVRPEIVSHPAAVTDSEDTQSLRLGRIPFSANLQEADQDCDTMRGTSIPLEDTEALGAVGYGESLIIPECGNGDGLPVGLKDIPPVTFPIRPLAPSEVLYGAFADERTEAAGKDGAVEKSVQPSSARGKTVPSAGQYPTDR